MTGIAIQVLAYVAWFCGSVAVYMLLRRRAADPTSVCVLVLGDIGRSPRMMYHAHSLIEHGCNVYLVGYAGTPLIDSLLDSPNIVTVHIRQPPRWISDLPRYLFLLVAPFKLLFGASSLGWALLVQLPTFPRAVVVQTPPALPTLPIVQFATRIQGSKLIIDWHNTAFSILAMRLGDNSPFTRLAERFEAMSGRSAFAHLFVTEAMKAHLRKRWSLRSSHAVAFHDRPRSDAARLSSTDAHALFSRISMLRDPALASLAPPYTQPAPGGGSTTLFTQSTSFNSADWRSDRPALLVSSTSYTADEDFTILLDALDAYDAAVEPRSLQHHGRMRLPKLVVLVTGKGPGKAVFVQEVKRREKSWKYTRVRTVWLEAGDYPRLLGAADLGVSLHSSSSGLDLPMKIVDMFGSGLPVLALDFACIGELVQEGRNGHTFQNPAELAQKLQALLSGFPECASLEHLRSGVLETSQRKWKDEWDETVLPIVADALRAPAVPGNKHKKDE